jgi:hypothetical protein
MPIRQTYADKAYIYISLFQDQRRTRPGHFCCLGYKPLASKYHYVEVNSSAQCRPHCPRCPPNSACAPTPSPCACANDTQFRAKAFTLQPCACAKGFVRNGTDRCHPICPDRCQDGRCANGTCYCDDGFAVSDVTGLCEAVCDVSGCSEGPCAEGCDCREGLVRREGGCVGCEGGDCQDKSTDSVVDGDGDGQGWLASWLALDKRGD